MVEEYKALYYPYIHFRDKAWLRRALLYWDLVGRIVPRSEWSMVKDDRDVMDLRSENLIIDLHAGMGSAAVELQFIKLLRRHEKALNKRYGIKTWRPKLPANLSKSQFLTLKDEANYVSIYLGKLTDELAQSFVDTKLGFKLHGSDEILLHEKLAGVYMTALARKVARSDYQPVTDDVMSHYALHESNIDHIARLLLPGSELEPSFSVPEEDAASVALFSFNVAFPDPKKLEQMSTKEFLRLRNSHRSEVPEFRADVKKFVRSYRWLGEFSKDNNKFQKGLQELYAETLKEKLEKRDEIVKELWKETGKAMLYISPMALISKGLPAMGLTMEPVSATIGAISLSTIPIIQKQRKDARSKLGPAVYIMKLNEAAEPWGRKAAFMRRARNFFFDV